MIFWYYYACFTYGYIWLYMYIISFNAFNFLFYLIYEYLCYYLFILYIYIFQQYLFGADMSLFGPDIADESVKFNNYRVSRGLYFSV